MGGLGPGFGFEIEGKPMCCAQIRLSGSQVSHTVIDHVCLYVCGSVLSTLTHTVAVWGQAPVLGEVAQTYVALKSSTPWTQTLKQMQVRRQKQMQMQLKTTS